MNTFEEDLQFANKVLRIRNAMITGELKTLPGVHEQTNPFLNELDFLFFGNVDLRSAPLGCLTFEKGVSRSIISQRHISYNTNDDKIAVFNDDLEQYVEVDIVDYDESLYFQHSLLYTPCDLRYLVTASVLKANEIPDRPNIHRFKFQLVHIPTIHKLLRYRDYGII